MKSILKTLAVCFGLLPVSALAENFVALDIGYEQVAQKPKSTSTSSSDIKYAGGSLGATFQMHMSIIYVGGGYEIGNVSGAKQAFFNSEIKPGLELNAIPLESGISLRGSKGRFTLGGVYDYGLAGKFTSTIYTNGIALSTSSSAFSGWNRMGVVSRAALTFGQQEVGFMCKYYTGGEIKYKYTTTEYISQISSMTAGIVWGRKL